MFDVITDTSANLPTPMLKERKIGVLAYSFYYDGKEYQCEDTETFDGHGFYQAIREGKPYPIKPEEAFEVVRVTEMVKKQNPAFKIKNDEFGK